MEPQNGRGTVRDDASASGGGLPLGMAVADEIGSVEIADALRSEARQKVPQRQIWPIQLAQFAMCIAAITPTAYSLAVWIDRISPANKDAILPIVLGVPSVLALILAPIINVLSDRTRSRLGRRRTWLLIGTIAGTLGSVLIVTVPSVAGVLAGWAIANVGYAAVSGMIIVHFSDRLPESQRGRVLGINGALTQIAPLVGVIVAGVVASIPVLIFLAPAALGLLGCGFMIVVMKDPKYTGERPKFSAREALQGFWINPRRYPDLAWVSLNKIFLYCAMAFMTVYTVYLLSSRLGMKASEVAGIVAIAGILGAVTGIVGAVGSGYLSDRLKSRKAFIIVSAVILAAGLVIIGLAQSVGMFLVGSAITAGAAGVYGAVDQALQLDVLPPAEDQNGRYLGVLGFAQQLPQAAGALLAGGVLALAGGDYGWVYFVAALLALVSIPTILPVRLKRAAAAGTSEVAPA